MYRTQRPFPTLDQRICLAERRNAGNVGSHGFRRVSRGLLVSGWGTFSGNSSFFLVAGVLRLKTRAEVDAALEAGDAVAGRGKVNGAVVSCLSGGCV